MKFVKIILILLTVIVAMSSCHSPEIEINSDYEVFIYPDEDDLFTLHAGHTYTFYAVVTPKSACPSIGAYHWETSGSQLTYKESGDISVAAVREALGSKYDIPDDSYCSYCTAEASTYSIGTLAIYIAYLANSTKLPYGKKYMKVTW